ncbi:hypothetical protein AB0878_45010 [Amycolatopsis sp. NPDC047767]|uniref:hypothetical protein n=1 Tax=Amycolatopsis sp. NPDC047767 TaxID=3156765 RepID=UPI003456B8B8
MFAHVLVEWLSAGPPPIPNPDPTQPPGADKILGLVGNAKWAAGVSLVIGFFIGLIVWAGGRWVDHHRAGKVGLVMMLCALGGALLYGLGWTVINGFAQAPAK